MILSASGGSHFLLSKGEDKIVFDASVDEESQGEEPPGEIFVYDLASAKMKRISLQRI